MAMNTQLHHRGEGRSGRVLRVKTGYNPNSSSVGSQIPYFFAFALSSGAITILVMNILAGFDRTLKEKKGQGSKTDETV